MPHLLVKNRDTTLFEGDIESISSYNKNGLFDVLLDHANFISIIEKGILIRQLGKQQQIYFENAILKVKGNDISIFVGVK